MSYPNRQADGTRKKGGIDNMETLDALPILRGRHQPGGLGSHRGVLCPLRGKSQAEPSAGGWTHWRLCGVGWNWSWSGDRSRVMRSRAGVGGSSCQVPACTGVYVWDALGAVPELSVSIGRFSCILVAGGPKMA